MLPDLDFRIVALPMTTEFRGIKVRHAAVVEGPGGWAEFSPFCEYDDAEALRWFRACVEMATQPFPAPRRHEIPVNVIVPAMPADAAAERVRASGCTTAKVKVAQQGQTLDDDVARVAAVREALGPDGRIRVDANTGWTPAQAVTALSELQQFGLEYAEQPAEGADGLLEVRRGLAAHGVAVPLAADEAIRRSDDPLAVREVADVAILKVQPLGGVTAALELAERLGLDCVVSSALDTSIGLRAGVALAAALPELPLACGLQTGTLFRSDVTSQPLIPTDGLLPVRDVVPDRLEDVLAPPEVIRWWERRIRRVRALWEETCR